MSFSESSGRQSQTNQFDPATLQTNQMRAQQLQGLIGGTGGLPGLTQQAGQLGQFGPQEMQWLQQLQGFAGQPLMRPQEQQALSQLQGMASPAAMQQLMQTGQQAFKDVFAPSIVNNLTAAGLGRSGAVGEALSSGAAQLSLPLMQQAFSQQHDAGSQLAALQAGLGGQMEQREMNRMLTGLEAAGMPRQAQFQSQVAFPQQALMGLLTGMPTLQAPLQTRGNFSQSGWGIDIGQLLGAVAGGVAMCWVADKLYGEWSPRSIMARVGVVKVWPRWAQALYRAVGRPVAHLGGARLFRRVFDATVRRGDAVFAAWAAENMALATKSTFRSERHRARALGAAA